jgi:dipeptidyl aminopeptidase/acylaminoacyl peptidase
VSASTEGANAFVNSWEKMMPDLKTRFRGADRIPAPHQWQEITSREPSQPRSGPSAAKRILVAAFAMAIAVAGISFTVHAFGGGNARPTPGAAPQPLGPKTNGLISFQNGSSEGGIWTDTIEPNGSGRQTIFGQDQNVSRVAWSPDGTRIAFVKLVQGSSRSPDGKPHWGIFTANPDGTDARELTGGVNDGWPAWLTWSPDGTRIAFSNLATESDAGSCVPGGDAMCPTDIYVMNADGTNVSQLTTDPPGEYQPSWSPDGTEIAFVRQVNPPDGGPTGIFVMNAEGSDVRNIASTTNGSDFAPSWSPDSSEVMYGSIRSEDWGIFVANADGTGERPIYNDKGPYVDDPVWSPDGTMVAFVGDPGITGSGGDSVLYVMGADGTGITKLADTPHYGVDGGIAWQPLPSMMQSPTTEPGVQPASKVYFAWPGEITVVDVSTDTASTVDVPTLGGGDPQYHVARVGDRLAYWGYNGTFAIDPTDLDAPPVKIASDSLYFVPSATPDRIWAVWRDPQASTPYHFVFDHLREISSDGTVQVDGVADGEAWMDGAVTSGVLMEAKDGLVVWDPRSGSVVARIPGAPSAAATFDDTVVWCDSYCRPSMHFTDATTGDTISVDPPPEYPVFYAWSGAFSPDGSIFAVPVWSTPRGGPRAIALVDVSTGSVTGLVPGSATDDGCCALSWDSTGQRLYFASFGPSAGNGEGHLSYWDVGSGSPVQVNVTIPRSTAMVAG